MSVVTRPVLVLSKAWLPICTTTVSDAICKMVRGRAKGLTDEFVMCDFDEWVSSWEDAVASSKVEESRLIKSSRATIVAPEIIVATLYDGKKMRKPRMTRKALFLRDDDTCQYCGKKLPREGLNIDHVVPRARGGKSSWTNLVLSCLDCNHRKGSKSPEEAGMKLIKQPTVPSWTVIQRSFRDKKNAPKSWQHILGRMYWNVDIEEKSSG